MGGMMKKRRMSTGRRRIMGWALAGLVGIGSVVWAREPLETRKLDAAREPATAARIEWQRDCLDRSYQRRNNFAWALAQVEGLGKKEYIAHSGIDTREDMSAESRKKIQNVISQAVPRKDQIFDVLCVNGNDVVDGPNCWYRHVDTEFKILEDLASRLPDQTVTGRVRLYTDLPPCASCRGVIRQFLDRYPNIQMQVLYRGSKP